MAKDELPDLDAIVREVGWIDHKAKRSAELAYEQARAHYDPIVAELRERVETLQQKLSESIAREEQLENSAESWRRVSEQLQNEKRELESEFSGARSSLRAYQRQSVARIVELEAQLSRSVFVLEMSDEDLVGIWRSHSLDGRIHPVAFARACIAAATKLPEGAARNSVQVDDNGFFLRLVFDGGRRDAIVMSQESSGRLHIVFIPEVPNA